MSFRLRRARRQNPIEGDKQKVVCLLCGQPFKMISATHLRCAHGITAADYQLRFPATPMQSGMLRDKHREDLRRRMDDGTWSQAHKRYWTEDRRSAQAELMRQQATERWQSDEFRALVLPRMSNGMKKAWSRPESRERHERGFNQPGVREKHRANTRRALSDPQLREIFSRTARRTWKEATLKKRRRMLPDPWVGGQAMAKRWHSLSEKERETERKVHARKTRELWQDPQYRAKLKPNWDKWYTEEKTVRGWLAEIGMYEGPFDSKKKGSKAPGHASFIGHGWLPTKGSGFSANGDFVDYSNGFVIHVDGPTHYADWAKSSRIARDADIDRWCLRNGWAFLRLTDRDIREKPNMCRGLIRLLTEGLIVPLYR